jgi:hypothetical protein
MLWLVIYRSVCLAVDYYMIIYIMCTCLVGDWDFIALCVANRPRHSNPMVEWARGYSTPRMIGPILRWHSNPIVDWAHSMLLLYVLYCCASILLWLTKLRAYSYAFCFKYFGWSREGEDLIVHLVVFHVVISGKTHILDYFENNL